VDEFELIRRFFVRSGHAAGVVVGVGDDGAVVTPVPGRDLVVVVDTLIAGVHYPASFPAADVGYRVLAVNLSDVAAMGGDPKWMTLALTLPEADESWLASFADGLFAAADPYGVALVGGDTTRGAQTVISVQLLGDASPDGPMLRVGAKPGDGIYVTGTLGDAAAGLLLLQGPAEGRLDSDASYLVRRFSRPSARVAFGASIAGIATAAIDLSDGLGADLLKLLRASGVSGSIDFALLPLSPQLRRAFGDGRAADLALDGGDDYELCFTARPADHARVVDLGAQRDLAVTRIGAVGDGTGLACTREGRSSAYVDRGYRHF
jgi:thiamine-monophosphate kinase